MLAEKLGSVTILAYEPPAVIRTQEDRVDFLMRPKGGEISLISLGPKGSFGDYLKRRRRVGALVKQHSADWDVLFVPLVNRRVGLVYDHSRCARVVAHIGGHTPSVVRDGPGRLRPKKLFAMASAALVERRYRQIARRDLFFVNGEALLPHYDNPDSPVQVLRSSARRARHSYRAEDRFTNSAPNLLVLSRLAVEKGVLDVVEAFALVRAGSLPHAHLHVIGNGGAEAPMRERLAELGLTDAATFHGWVPAGDELFGRLESMDALLTLSLAESLPKTVWECMAHSVLVVSTPVGSLPDVFAHEQDLLFVPPQDPAAAAAAIERLAADPELRARLLARGRASAAEITLEAVAASLVDRIVERWPELQAKSLSA